MSLFKITRGNELNLPTELVDGCVYFCVDTGNIYIDYVDTNNDGGAGGGGVIRSRISGEFADKLRYIDGGVLVEIDPVSIITTNDGLVRYDTEQSLIEDQQMQARENLGLYYSEENKVLDSAQYIVYETDTLYIDGLEDAGAYRIEITDFDTGESVFTGEGDCEYYQYTAYDYEYRILFHRTDDSSGINFVEYDAGQWDFSTGKDISGQNWKITVYHVAYNNKIPERFLPIDGDSIPNAAYFEEDTGRLRFYNNTASLFSAYIPPFTGANAEEFGYTGLVPAPSAGDKGKVLYGDGTWADLPAQVQADWEQLDLSAFDYVRSKPFGYSTEGFALDDGNIIYRIDIESGTSGEYRCIYNAGSNNLIGSRFAYSYMASDANIYYYLMYSMYGLKSATKDVICIGGENWGYGNAITNTDEAAKPYTWAIFAVGDISTLNEEYKEHFTNRGIYFINYREDTQVEWVSLVIKKFISDTFIPSTIARTADISSTYATKSELESYETAENAQAKLDESKSYTDTSVANLVNSAPEALNTLDELATALGNDENFATTVATQIGEKANTTDLTAHTTNISNPHSVTKDQVGLSNVANVLQYSAENPPPYPVTSVAGQTGAVTFTTEALVFTLSDGSTVTKNVVVM